MISAERCLWTALLLASLSVVLIEAGSAATVETGGQPEATNGDAGAKGSWLNWLVKEVGRDRRAANNRKQVNGHLQSSGQYLSQQMSALTQLAPKIRAHLGGVPAKLRGFLRWPTFLNFKIKFNKVYRSLSEELHRQMIYLRTQTRVAMQNIRFLLGKTRYLLRATQFADVTDKEYQRDYDNRLAETDASEGAPRLEEEALGELRRLSETGRSLFGPSLAGSGPPASRAGKSRKRRSPNELDYDEQFGEEEEDDDNEAHHLEEWLEEEDEAEEGGGGARLGAGERLAGGAADEFEAEADLGALEELEDLLDAALDQPRGPFEPVDLRRTGCLIRPENQNRCGCCYAQVTAAVAAYFNCMRAKTEAGPTGETAGAPSAFLNRYNARFISDCGRYLTPEGRPPLVNGCSGGRLSHAIAFTKEAGTYHFTDYEIARVSNEYETDRCAFPRPPKLESWTDVRVPHFEESRFVHLKLWEADLYLRTVGPVMVNVRTWAGFNSQGAGIYDGLDESETPIIHSMLIVGHQLDHSGRPYWILWNSHGTGWGERGFVRISNDSLDHFLVYLAGLMPAEARLPDLS